MKVAASLSAPPLLNYGRYLSFFTAKNRKQQKQPPPAPPLLKRPHSHTGSGVNESVQTEAERPDMARVEVCGSNGEKETQTRSQRDSVGVKPMK